MTRTLRPAAELVSDIGSLAFTLRHHSNADIAEAVTFLRTVNPEMFDWLAKLLAAHGVPEHLQPSNLPAAPLEASSSPVWEPIETAPTDGTNVLLFIPKYAMGRLPYAIIQGWNLASDRRGWRSQYAGGIVEPTHWMPLPPAPKEPT